MVGDLGCGVFEVCLIQTQNFIRVTSGVFFHQAYGKKNKDKKQMRMHSSFHLHKSLGLLSISI